MYNTYYATIYKTQTYTLAVPRPWLSARAQARAQGCGCRWRLRRNPRYYTICIYHAAAAATANATDYG